MLSLGIDCSEFGVSVALAKESELLSQLTCGANKKTSKFLVSQIEQLFENNDQELKEVKRICVAYGPGSFTGLKISVTAGKVLALCNQAKLYGISSLKNLSYPLLGTNQPVLAMLSARHGNFYAGVYQKQNSNIVSLVPDEYVNFSKLETQISDFKNLLIIGSGLDEFIDKLQKYGAVVSANLNNLIPGGYSTILLSENERSMDPEKFVPMYLRDPQAVLNWKKNRLDSESIKYVEEI